METLLPILTSYATVVGFAVGAFLGFIIGWVARGIYKEKRASGGRVDVLAILTSTFVIALWGLAHINNIFFGGGDVNWVLNVIGGLAVSSLVQEKDSFVKIVSAFRSK